MNQKTCQVQAVSELLQTANRATHEAYCFMCAAAATAAVITGATTGQHRHQKLIGTVPASLKGQRDD